MMVGSELFANEPSLDSMGKIEPHNDAETTHPCKEWNKSCGEAGCIVNQTTGELQCVCPSNFKPPDEQGRCLLGGHEPIDSSHIPPHVQLSDINPGIVLNSTQYQFGTKLNSTYKAITHDIGVQLNPSKNQGSQVDLTYVLIPIGIVLVVVITVVIILLLRHKSRLHRSCSTHRNDTHLHKQEATQLMDKMLVVGKNPNYTLHVDLNSKLNLLDVTHIDREHLNLMQEIGEGAFGKVYKGKVKWSDECSSFVAVKILKQDALRETQDDFLREVQIMCSFSHENILSLLGIVNVDNGSPFMVFELMEYGDLTELLRKNDPSRKGCSSMHLKKVDLIHIATQIANGMCYLSEQHFVHRDLATRNCLVGTELQVKISDFGMSRDIYTCDYYKIGGTRLLPVRWMSPESIKYGRFTSESDVWSFGVTLWEIFAYGKQPYYGHANEEVIRLLDDGILLQRPDHCPDEVFSIMLACWRTEVTQRFTFKRIYRHLKDINNRCSTVHQPRTGPEHYSVVVQLENDT